MPIGRAGSECDRQAGVRAAAEQRSAQTTWRDEMKTGGRRVGRWCVSHPDVPHWRSGDVLADATTWETGPAAYGSVRSFVRNELQILC